MQQRGQAVLLGIILLVSSGTLAADWPKIPESDWKITTVSDFPNAAAVVLEREGRVHFDKKSRSSYLDVYTRIKILTSEGVDYGSVQLSSSDYMRVKKLEGRTHLPDGRTVDLPAEAHFKKEYSDYFGSSIVSCAMPEVVKGAIIEYRYRVFFDSIFYPRAWYFQTDIPVLSSRVSFEIPHNLSVVPLVYKTLKNIDLKEDVHENVEGGRLSYVARNLPPVPDEPSRFPFHDLSSRVLMLPVAQRDGNGMKTPLFDNWKNTVSLVWGYHTWGYGHFLSDNGKAKKIAKSLRVSGNPIQSARAIFTFVRDEIQTRPSFGIWVGEETADDLIRDQKGDYVGKALLLHSMLKAAKIDSDILWISPKTRNQVQKTVPDPTQFQQAIVRAEIKGRSFFLDPGDRTLAFGTLRPSMQGVPALVVRRKKPDWAMTPAIPAEDSFKKAALNLSIDSDGRVSGQGSLSLGGNHAWMRLGWKDTDDETKTAWTEWIEDACPDYDIDDVEVSESIENQLVRVNWRMRERDNPDLGFEVSLNPSSPLTLASNPYTLSPNRRWTPLQLLYPDIEIVDLTISWPDNFFVDIKPQLKTFSNDAGSLKTTLEIQGDARKAHLRREWTISKTSFAGAEQYSSLQELFKAVLTNDSEELILAAE